MSDMSKPYDKVAIKVEAVAGVAETTFANSDYFDTMEAVELAKSVEAKEITSMRGTRWGKKTRLGLRGSEMTVPMWMKASATKGAAPKAGIFWQSYGFNLTSIVELESEADGHDATHIDMGAAVSNFSINQPITIQDAGGDIINVVKSIAGSVIELLVPIADPGDVVLTLSAITVAKIQDRAEYNYSLTMQGVMDGGQVVEVGWGLRCNKITLSNFTVGEYPSISYGFSGLSWADKLLPSPISPVVPKEVAEVPLVLETSFFVDGVQFDGDEFAIELGNETQSRNSFNAASGKAGNRHMGDREITGSFNSFLKTTGYHDEGDDTLEHLSLDGREISILTCAYTPGENGEKKEMSIYFIPRAIITEEEDTDKNGYKVRNFTFVVQTEDQEKDSPRVGWV